MHKGNFFVIDMGQRDVIIGMDWLVDNHELVGCEERTLTFRNKTNIQHKVKGLEKGNKEVSILAMKLLRGIKQGCETFLVFANEIMKKEK